GDRGSDVGDGADLGLAGVSEADLVIGVEVEGVVDLGKERRDGDAVWGEKRPTLSAKKFQSAARKVSEVDAEAERIGVGADVGVSGEDAVEVGFGVPKDASAGEVLVGAKGDARILCGQAGFAQAALYGVAIGDGGKGGSESAADVAAAVDGREVHPAAGSERRFPEVDGELSVTGGGVLLLGGRGADIPSQHGLLDMRRRCRGRSGGGAEGGNGAGELSCVGH